MNAVSIKNVSKSFNTIDGKKIALQDVSFSVEEGSCVLIGGANGSGKSLLMSIIAKLEEADSGSVESIGRIGLVFQEAETQILGESAREDIAFGLKNLKKSKEEINQTVEAVLKKTGLEEKANFPARFLSGGEKRRLAIACMLAMNTPVIVLDEPYANLDYAGIKQVNSFIKELKSEKKTIIILSHELEKCLGLADKFVILFKGKKVFEGSPEEGLKQNLEQWNIRNPLVSYCSASQMIW